MTENRKKLFDEFLSRWQSENVKALSDQRGFDPSDQKWYIERKADQLKEDAQAAGFLHLLYDEIGVRSDVHKYVKGLFEAADSRKRAGIG